MLQYFKTWKKSIIQLNFSAKLFEIWKNIEMKKCDYKKNII